MRMYPFVYVRCSALVGSPVTNTHTKMMVSTRWKSKAKKLKNGEWRGKKNTPREGDSVIRWRK